MNDLKNFFNSKIFIYLFMNIILLLPSFRLLLKFFNVYVLIAYLIASNILIFLFFNYKKNIKILDFPLWKYFLILFTIANYFIYPMVDARKKSGKYGSTADDAVIVAVETLKGSGKLYDATLVTKEPISPGPGWLLMNSGFVLSDCYFLLNPFYLCIALFLISKYYKTYITNSFLFILMMALIYWELFFNGHDITAFSLGFLACMILIYENFRKEQGVFKIILMGILIGLISTSRVVFFFIPFIYFFMLKKDNKKNSWIILIASLVTFIGFNGYFYSINNNFQPAHLMHRAQTIMGTPLMIICALILICALYFVINKLQQNNLVDWLRNMTIAFSVFFIPIGLADLFRLNFHFIIWEGANYFVPVIPFAILYFIYRANSKRIGLKPSV